MENKISVLLALLLGFVLTSCDKFDLDFKTKNHFNLDASSHELEVKTEQDNPWISDVILNGKEFYIIGQEDGFNGIQQFDEFEVHYKNREPNSIEGEWFKVEVIDDYTFHISVSENDESTYRELILILFWRTAENKIAIRQEKK